MKMSPGHFEALKARVAQVMPQVPAHREKLRNDPRVKDLEKRLLWDVYHSARMHQLYSPQQWDYADAHIETAMRKILRECEK